MNDSNDPQRSQSSSHPPFLTASSSTVSISSLADSSRGLHRRRTLYLIRHGEAVHNVLEAIAEKEAKLDAERRNLSPEETYAKMEEARQSVLTDPSLRDAPLTERGRQQAREVSQKLQAVMNQGKIHPPTEAMCSPLSRCLETTKIVLENSAINAHVRPELTERKTQFPPDTPRPLEELLRLTRDDDRFIITHIDQLSKEVAAHEAMVRESKEMLRARAGQMFDLLMEMEHRHILVVSHKGFLRELERGLLEIPDSPLFRNCELRVYRVIFTRRDRSLHHLERLV
ncbi:fructose-2,6-bisphosphatase [Nitzschia inconspicua]|uniref:Fructose-2,6-bisphosphatase n=1 Tax=Nitzschia inconspicua TaxID=303405 RepID=A0A9K3LDS8_9STRA|nr:fructose-2,6-bisphosphatase [Nitzschia inconspicua]